MAAKTTDAELRAKAPDGGWGWVIVVASFFNMAFCMSTIFSFAVIFVEWKEVFHSPSSVVALLGSVLSVFAFGFSEYFLLFMCLIVT